MTINERIKVLLKEKNKKQTELADFIGVSQNTVSDWINKGKSPSANLAYRISDFFGVSLDYLFTGKEFSIPVSAENMTEDQIELLKNYVRLDQRGKHKIHTVIYEEMDRMDGKNSVASSDLLKDKIIG
ncbi:helix-turn-helix transcriptional regulator [Lachnospiraceae bacterium 54-53]